MTCATKIIYPSKFSVLLVTLFPDTKLVEEFVAYPLIGQFGIRVSEGSRDEPIVVFLNGS